jgi:phosphoglycolate phosphatase
MIKSKQGQTGPFQGVIFDLDGTLLDTLACIGAAFNQALTEIGYPTHPIQDYKNFIGDGVFKCAERALPKIARQPEIIDALVTLERRLYETVWRREIAIYDGIPELLEALRAQSVPTAVLTNKDQDAAIDCLIECFPQHTFDCVLGYTGTYPHKPDPACGAAVIKTLGLRPDQLMMVGDTPVDLATARACSLFAVGVSWGFRNRETLIADGLDVLIEHPLELLHYV